MDNKIDLAEWRTAVTPAEQRVLEGLLAGTSLKKLSSAYGVSLWTIRSQIRDAKRKLGYSGPTYRLLLDLQRAA